MRSDSTCALARMSSETFCACTSVDWRVASRSRRCWSAPSSRVSPAAASRSHGAHARSSRTSPSETCGRLPVSNRAMSWERSHCRTSIGVMGLVESPVGVSAACSRFVISLPQRRSENRGAHADHRGPFLDRHLEIPAHSHRQLAQHRRRARPPPATRRGARAAAGTRAARLPACRAPAAASSARRPARRGSGRGLEERRHLAGGTPNFVASPARSTWMSSSGVRPASAAAAIQLLEQFDAVHRLNHAQTPAPPSAPCSSAGGRAGAT